jgi:hypothetical protein
MERAWAFALMADVRGCCFHAKEHLKHWRDARAAP